MLKKLFMAASVSFADLATGNLSYKITDSLSLDFSPAYISFDAYGLYSVSESKKNYLPSKYLYTMTNRLKYNQSTAGIIRETDDSMMRFMLVSPSISVPFSIVYNHYPSLSFGYDVSMSVRYFLLKWTDDKKNPYIPKNTGEYEAPKNADEGHSSKGKFKAIDSTSFNGWPIASFFVEYNFAIWSVKYHLGQALYAYNMYSLPVNKTRMFPYAESVFSALHGFEFKLNICHGWIASILLNSIFRSALTWVISAITKTTRDYSPEYIEYREEIESSKASDRSL